MPETTELIAPKLKTYIPILDGLRAVSIVLVLVGHDTLYNSPSKAIQEAGFLMGSFGVSVFFVVSGYLITMLLLREEWKNGRISLRGFYIRRALRLFPAFYAYLAVIGVLCLTGVIQNAPWHDFAAAVLYARNVFGHVPELDHLWSLSLEEQFYFIWPSVVVLVAARRRLPVLALAVVAFTAWRAYRIATGHATTFTLYMRPDLRMDTILVGCGLALLEGGPRFERLSLRVLERPWFGLSVFATLAAWAGSSRSMERATPYFGVIHHTTTAVLIVLAVHWAIRNAHSLPWLQTAPMLFVGRLSYSLYLWQQLFLITSTARLTAIRWFPLDMILTVVFALGSYHLIERPFLKLKDRLH